MEMEEKDYSGMSDEELLVEKQKLKNSRIMHALLIGFMAGVLIFGVVGWSLSSEKRIGFFIPMLIPIVAIYNMLKNPKKNDALENALKERSLME